MEKTCNVCGKAINEGDKFCQACGAKVENEVVQQAVENNVQNNTSNKTETTNGSAIAGFICSLVGIFVLGIWLGIIAICLGVSAKKHIKLFENEKGNGLATAAIVIGIIDIVGAILMVILNVIIATML